MPVVCLVFGARYPLEAGSGCDGVIFRARRPPEATDAFTEYLAAEKELHRHVKHPCNMYVAYYFSWMSQYALVSLLREQLLLSLTFVGDCLGARATSSTSATLWTLAVRFWRDCSFL